MLSTSRAVAHTAKIYATIMAQDQKGIAIGDNRKDIFGRINANFNLLDDLLEIGLHTEYREAHRDQRSSSSYFDMALKMNRRNMYMTALVKQDIMYWLVVVNITIL